jgi:protein gp37
MKVEWVEEIEQACRQYGAAFFFKQWGGVNKKRAGRQWRGSTSDEMPSVSLAS